MAGIGPEKFVILCPSTLKDADWQKKKGKAGKLTKTGLGAELKTFEAMLKKVDVSALDPGSNPVKSEDELQRAVARSKQEYDKNVAPLQKQLKKVEDAAIKAAAALKKNPLAKSAVKAAEAIAKDADYYSVTCKSIDTGPTIDKMRSDIKRKNDLAAQHLVGSLKKFAAGSKVFLADPTKDNWQNHIKQQGRSVSNSVAQLQNYRKQFWSTFEKFKGFDSATLGIKDDEFDSKAVKIVKLALVQVKGIAAFKG